MAVPPPATLLFSGSVIDLAEECKRLDSELAECHRRIDKMQRDFDAANAKTQAEISRLRTTHSLCVSCGLPAKGFDFARQ